MEASKETSAAVPTRLTIRERVAPKSGQGWKPPSGTKNLGMSLKESVRVQPSLAKVGRPVLGLQSPDDAVAATLADLTAAATLLSANPARLSRPTILHLVIEQVHEPLRPSLLK